MEIRWSNRAVRSLRRLDAQTRRRIVGKVEEYAATRQGDLRHIVGRPGELGLRVGDWRVFFTVDVASNTLQVLDVAHRSDAYR